MQRIFVRDVNKQFKYFYVVFLVQVISKLAVLWGIISRTVNVWSGAVLQQQLYGTCKWRYVYKNITFHIKTRRLINNKHHARYRTQASSHALQPFFLTQFKILFPALRQFLIHQTTRIIYLFIYLFIYIRFTHSSYKPTPSNLPLFIY